MSLLSIAMKYQWYTRIIARKTMAKMGVFIYFVIINYTWFMKFADIFLLSVEEFNQVYNVDRY